MKAKNVTRIVRSVWVAAALTGMCMLGVVGDGIADEEGCDITNLTMAVDLADSSATEWTVVITGNMKMPIYCTPGTNTTWSRHNADTHAVIGSDSGGGNMASTVYCTAAGYERATGEQLNFKGTLSFTKSTTPSYVVMTKTPYQDCTYGEGCGGDSDTATVFLPPLDERECPVYTENPINLTTGNLKHRHRGESDRRTHLHHRLRL